MTAPTLPVLGAATVNRKWVYEFNLGTPGSPVWVSPGGMVNSQFQPDQPNWVGDTDQAGKGFQSSSKTGATWGGSLTLSRKVTQPDPTVYDSAQEFLRTTSIGKFGPLNTVQLRVYEYDPNDPTGARTPRTEAYMGYAGVSWEPQGGDMLAEDEVVVTITGQGPLFTITHPVPKTASLIPVIASVTPGTTGTIPVAGSKIVDIVGTGLSSVTGAAGVKFGGTNAVDYTVKSDILIEAIAPAKSAGSVTVVVTNATGASAGTAVTYA